MPQVTPPTSLATTVKTGFMSPRDARRSLLMTGLTLLTALAITALASAAHAQSAASANPNQALLVLASTSQGGSSAQARRLAIDAAFDRADSNHDGRLDRQEAEHLPAVAQDFEQVDSNHDQFISREELHSVAGL